jgi:hypothetical protein
MGKKNTKTGNKGKKVGLCTSPAKAAVVERMVASQTPIVMDTSNLAPR